MSVALGACSPDPPETTPSLPPEIETAFVYESERVAVFIEPEMPFCRGDGVRMDQHMNRLSAHIGVAPPEQVQVYIVGDDRGAIIADWCSASKDTLGGCVRSGMVMAKIWAIPHELNHVVFHALNSDAQDASRFWFEAYASAYETDETEQYFSGLAEQSESAAYHVAHHLIRWLEDTYGEAPVVEFYVGLERGWDRSEADAAFAQVFGLSYEEALEKYATEAAVLYPGYGWCDDVEVIDVSLGETHVTLRADCAGDDTYAFADPAIEAMYVRRVLRLEQHSEVLIETSLPIGILNRHPCFDEPAYSEDDPRLGMWYRDIAGGIPPMGTPLGPMEMAAGDNLVEFVFLLGEPVEVDLVITADPLPDSN
ncbi:MAG: hypothetical protein HC927_11140 [Deltaproteobacteria bacterium]|nr:hypothetical protein [Deltaproteobacteria bacterium]